MKKRYLVKLCLSIGITTCLINIVNAVERERDFDFSFQAVNNTDLPLKNLKVRMAVINYDNNATNIVDGNDIRGTLLVPELPQNTYNLASTYNVSLAMTLANAHGSIFWAPSVSKKMTPPAGFVTAVASKAAIEEGALWSVDFKYGTFNGEDIEYRSKGSTDTWVDCNISLKDANADPASLGITSVFIEAAIDGNGISQIKKSTDGIARYTNQLRLRISRPVSGDCFEPLEIAWTQKQRAALTK